jgi:cytochrome b561
MTPGTVAIAVAVPLIGWRLYRRIRKLIGRQSSRLWRHWSAATLFPLVLALLAFAVLSRPVSLAILGGAIAVGIGLALWGLKLTKFERTPEGFFYTPDAHIGITLSLLLVARIAFRFYEISTMPLPTGPAPMEFARSPLTLVVLGMLASYYATYAAGLLRWRRAS